MSGSALPGERTTDVAVVGAGPIGLEVAAALRRAGIDYVHFDRDQVGATIFWFPRGMTFFSSNDRIAIAGLPIQNTGQRKSTREEYLAYLRSVALALDLRVRTHEEVTDLARADDGTFRLTVRSAAGEALWSARRVVLAIGDMHGPRLLGIPGEGLPHVSHYFDEPHRYFRKRLLVVGGRNSAVEAALRCWHAGAEVHLCHRKPAIEEGTVKYWLLPELAGRIERGEIACHPGTTPVEITPTAVVLERGDGGRFSVPADFVLLLTGYVPDPTIFLRAGVELHPETKAPAFDERTMETNVEGLYVAGTATAGEQREFRVFIETSHVHAERIVRALTGAPPPEPPQAHARPES